MTSSRQPVSNSMRSCTPSAAPSSTMATIRTLIIVILFVITWLPWTILSAPSAASLAMDECIASCGNHYTQGRLVTICGTDGVTHALNFSAYYSWWDHNHCYLRCGLTAQYVGPCGCPNDCYHIVGNGKCTDGTPPIPSNDAASASSSSSSWAYDKFCSCDNGFDGPDCSRVACPDNYCEGHGVCEPDYLGGIDRCICDLGWTGMDCGSQQQNLATLPFGSAFPGAAYQLDRFGDKHPLFNISSIIDVTIHVSDADLALLLSPTTLRNDTVIPANISIFGQPHFYEHVSGAGLRFALGPDALRFMWKKAFEIRFDAFDSQERFYDLGGLTFKSGTLDNIVRAQLYNELARASLVPAPRSSFAWLTINRISWGLYNMAEGVDAQFAHSRFGTPLPVDDDDDDKTDRKEDLDMKNVDGSSIYHGRSGYFESDGTSASSYMNAMVEDTLGIDVHQYSQERGPVAASAAESWHDFVSFVSAVNKSINGDATTSAAAARAAFVEMFDTDVYIRNVILESFLINQNGWMLTGSSYALFHDDVTDVWRLVLHHVDDYLHTLLLEDRNIWHYIDRRLQVSPLNQVILGHADYNATLLVQYHQFINNIFGNATFRAHIHPADRFSRLAELVKASMEQDILWQYSTGAYFSDFTVAVTSTHRVILNRVDEVAHQLPDVPSSSPGGTNEVVIIIGIGGAILVLAIGYCCWRRHWNEMSDEALLSPPSKMGGAHDGLGHMRDYSSVSVSVSGMHTQNGTGNSSFSSSNNNNGLNQLPDTQQ